MSTGGNSTTNVEAVLNRLTKWRTVFASWQLGTRSKEDPECQAVNDHRELTILLRVEGLALVSLLTEKGVFTREEWAHHLVIEAAALDAWFERRFPGFKDQGIVKAALNRQGIVITAEAAETMRGWRP